MAQAEQQPASSIIGSISEMAKRRVEVSAAMQAELFKEVQEISQHWSERAKAETELFSDLISKLASAGSPPENAKVCQEWVGRRMSMAVEDGQRFFADGIKFMEVAARTLSNGGASNSSRS